LIASRRLAPWRLALPSRVGSGFLTRGIAAAALLLGLARAVSADPPDPLLPLVHGIDSYFHRHEIDGITKDPRFPLNPTEVTRLSIVSQLLAYSDLYAVDSLPGHRDDIIQRADFVLLHYNEVLSHTAFDG